MQCFAAAVVWVRVSLAVLVTLESRAARGNPEQLRFWWIWTKSVPLAVNLWWLTPCCARDVATSLPTGWGGNFWAGMATLSRWVIRWVSSAPSGDRYLQLFRAMWGKLDLDPLPVMLKTVRGWTGESRATGWGKGVEGDTQAPCTCTHRRWNAFV